MSNPFEEHTGVQWFWGKGTKTSISMLLSAVFFVASWAAGCGSGDPPQAEDHELVPAGKADDFYSTTAQEFAVRGYSTVTLESSYETADATEKLDRARQLADAKTTIIATYLNYYVVDKSEHSSNPEYGGFHAMARPASFDPTSVEPVSGLTYRFEFVGEIGAALDFPDKIPRVTDAQIDVPLGATVLRLTIPKLDAADIEGSWKYRYSPSSFDPEGKDPSTLEVIDLLVTEEDISDDAYLDYRSLFADGKLTVGIHFGWDYNDQRYDIQEAKQVFTRLVGWGFAAPVDSFDDLTIDSEPFTKTVTANGRDILVEIKLVHAGMVDAAAQGGLLRQALVDSLENREVILFNGHAGFSGRLLPGNWQASSSGVISPDEIATLDLPSTYQIVLVNGCDTYAKFADEFRANPAKQDAQGRMANLDLLTTTSFSWLSQMGDVDLEILKALTGGWGDQVTVRTWDELLTRINDGASADVYFGVHGIDSDPRFHPFGRADLFCRPCARDQDCGGQGNLCVRMLDGSRSCVPTCLDDSGCAAEGLEATCQRVATGGVVRHKQCVPARMTCAERSPTQGPDVIINEVLADPPAGIAGDANGDGTRSYRDDEFIEIVNVSDRVVDLSGWSLADSYAVRFRFPEGTSLPARAVVVVFGGGNPATFQLPAGVVAFAADQGLGLTNSGDSVVLSDRDGEVVDAMSFGPEGGQDRSLTRANDADPAASFVPHPADRAFSPGLRSDGRPF